MESKWFGCAVVGVLVLVAVVPVGLGQGPRTAQIASIVEVVFETLAAGGVTPGPTQVLAIRELETLDENVKEALVGLFQAFAVFERQSGTSFGRGTGATDLNDFLDARAALAKATDGFLGALGPAPASHSAAPLVADVHAQLKILPHPKLTTDGGVAASLGTDDANHTDFSTSFEATVNSGDPALWTARQDTNACVKFSIPPIVVAPRLSIDFTGADNTYTGDFAFQIDGCGDDEYRNNAGGSNVGLGCPSTQVRPAGFLLDVGGDDIYGNLSLPQNCGKVGGGFHGAGFLVDASGDDHYVGGNNGVVGGGFLGAGFLLDISGDDTYTAGAFGTIGGGNTGGMGTLVDAGGADTYSGAFAGVNGGATLGGMGFLLDVSGNDLRVASAGGTNGGGGIASVGRLVDLDGNDSYFATILAVNGGGGNGLGLLLDRRGTDVYSDGEGGSGTDVDVAPKGTGFQLDL